MDGFTVIYRDASLTRWAGWSGCHRGPVESCSILTTTPNSLLAEVHDRMPVILDPDCYELWLDSDLKDTGAVTEMLKPFDARRMKRYPVSARVNLVKNDDPDCAAAIQKVQ
jgi:putative SOS response-associated peptidase YedK